MKTAINGNALVWIYVLQFAKAQKLPFYSAKDRENAFELYLANASVNN